MQPEPLLADETERAIGMLPHQLSNHLRSRIRAGVVDDDDLVGVLLDLAAEEALHGARERRAPVVRADDDGRSHSSHPADYREPPD
jgi:hypothetical protein